MFNLCNIRTSLRSFCSILCNRKVLKSIFNNSIATIGQKTYFNSLLFKTSSAKSF